MSTTITAQQDTAKQEPTAQGLYGLQQPSRAGKIPKPIMEKRRRARINKCLEELKVLVPDLTDSGTRVDKADVLEMTVEHLTRMKNKRRNLSSNLTPHVTPYIDPHNQFKQGYQQCMSEVTKLLMISKVDENVTHKLVEHLSKRTAVLQPTSPLVTSSPLTVTSSPLTVTSSPLAVTSSPLLQRTRPLVVPEPIRSSHIPHYAFTPAQYAHPVPTYPSPPSSPVDTTRPLTPTPNSPLDRFHLPNSSVARGATSPPQLADKTLLMVDRTSLLAALPSIARRHLPEQRSERKVWRPW